MSGKKSNRQRQQRQHAAREARARALAARQRKEKKRRRALGLVGVVVAAAVLLVISLNTGGKKTTDVATTATTKRTNATTATSLKAASAAGRPCVPVAGALPQGAPPVGVKEGPPPTALVIEDIKPGTGAVVPAGATVTVNYVGVACSTGAVFDASYGKDPATFPLGQVIKGWQDGIPGMKVGGQRLLGIPSALAYGAEGRPPKIAGDEALWFVIDLIDVKAA